tara:strand:+ start:172 stop:378 length:207 start_codon:yes stop_codon:yes gene_type:complete
VCAVFAIQAGLLIAAISGMAVGMTCAKLTNEDVVVSARVDSSNIDSAIANSNTAETASSVTANKDHKL